MELNNETLQLAKAFEGMTLSKKDAVSKFGSEGQKEHFEKYKKFTNKKIGEALKKTLDQLFETVDDTVKVGRGYGYKLGEVRSEIAERVRNIGGNTTNGNWKQSTRHLDALILAHLENDIENHVEIEKSVVGWMYEFNMINKKAYELHVSRFNKQLREQIQDDIKKLVQSEDYRVVDQSYKFIQNDIRYQKETLLSALKRMTKHNIVETFDRPKTMRLNDETGLPENKIDVDMKTYKFFTNKKRELRERLEITDGQINNYTYEKANIKEKIDEYKEELKEALSEVEVTDAFGNTNVIAISHVWLDLAIIVKATKKKTMEYLHKFHAEILKEYKEYKETKYLSSQAVGYKSCRTEERLGLAEKKKDRNIEHKKADDEFEQNRWAMGKSRYAPDHYEKQARHSKDVFMRAIEILDRVYADKFIIDEEKIEAALKKEKSNDSVTLYAIKQTSHTNSGAFIFGD